MERVIDIKEIEAAIQHARSIHGEGFDYTARRGVRVELKKLKPGENVCAGGSWFHILMTPKEAGNG